MTACEAQQCSDALSLSPHGLQCVSVCWGVGSGSLCCGQQGERESVCVCACAYIVCVHVLGGGAEGLLCTFVRGISICVYVVYLCLCVHNIMCDTCMTSHSKQQLPDYYSS